ncbi:MAG: CHASE2 domain-containing protein [Proteobacteria bacterium]|nr:CHASE2 domain-containing protein [Pseudomonadota bacterium]
MQTLLKIISPLLVLLVCAVLAQTSFFPWLPGLGLDICFKLRGVQQTSQSIIIIGIDEQSLETIEPWPFPRALHAELLTRLQLAKSVGFDVLFPALPGDEYLFSNAVENAPQVSVAVASDYQGKLLAPALALKQRVKVGHIETELGGDGIIRRVHLVKHDLPVLSVAMVKDIGVNSSEQEGSRLINFYGPEFTFLYVSYSDVLEGSYEQEFFKDRYVLVGSQALGLGDVHITPYSNLHPIPGVEIQATILNNYIDGSFIRSSKWFDLAISIIALLVCTFFWPQKSETKNIVFNLVLTFSLDRGFS